MISLKIILIDNFIGDLYMKIKLPIKISLKISLKIILIDNFIGDLYKEDKVTYKDILKDILKDNLNR